MAVQQAGRSRTRNWEEAEVRCFLEMWAEEEIQQQLDGTVRNKKVFKDMAERMAEAGFIRTADQLRDKLKKLKKDYKDARSNNESSGAGRQQCPFYDILHQIIGHRPTLEPEVLIDTADDKSQDGQRQEDDEADDVVQVPPAPATDTDTATATDVEEANPTPENQEAEQSTSSDGSTPRTTIGKRKRRQPSTSSRQEEVMDKVTKRFIEHQDAARRDNREWEERREEEQERREERRRQEEREHELRLFQMMGQMLQQQQQNIVTTPAGRSYMDM